MNILLMGHSYNPEISGVSEVLKQVALGLLSKGHKIYLATGLNNNLKEKEIISGIHVSRFKVKGNLVNKIHGDIKGYLNHVISGAWDLVSFHCAQTWVTDALLPYLKDIRVPKVFVSHGLSAYRNPQYKSYFGELAKALVNVDRIIALSDLLEEVPFCANNGLPSPQIIPNGVDLLEWNSPPQNIRCKWSIEKRPWVLSVSNHSPVKGHESFYEVGRLVRRNVPNLYANIIGDGYPAAKWDIGRFGIKGGCWYQCRSKSYINKAINLYFNVPRSAVISCIKEADIVLVTSSREASPLVVLESMAAGTPWVSFDVGCVREHVGGVVVKDIHEMAEVVCDLLRCPEKRKALGEVGRKRVIERHSWDMIVDQYEALYQDLVEKKRQARLS
jgi:glycosyltransferase involved in cell wall biosynthesis